MNTPAKYLLALLGVLALGALGAWGWHQSMEKKWEPVPGQSDAARRNRMLAATMLLRQDARSVTVAGSLGELALDKLPDGTLILADASGVMEQDKAKRLLAWVRRGNTLVAQPRWITAAEEAQLKVQIAEQAEADGPATATAANEDASTSNSDDSDEEEEPATADSAAKAGDSSDELVENDPIAVLLGARLFFAAPPGSCARSDKAGKSAPKDCKPVRKSGPAMRHVELPGAGYRLELNAGYTKLISMPGARQALWSDDDASTVRVYAEAKGKIVMLADDFFNNRELREHDHGELLLALAALNQASRQVTIVQNLDAVPWYRLLWKHYSMALLALAALLALLFWAGVRRFGPVLPQSAIERRSLMEHIDASGAWLWKAEGGRQVLLDAARQDTLDIIRRRAPALFRLPQGELYAALARLCALPEVHVSQALNQAAASTSLHFTRQIRILQELRNHHER
ncbi:DUF4350 domain-containing protein [Massilia sp. TSP1-1-2]|uniref:DUF4350 domain-containing protein n=1 Tax=Massilia sp. TSP1-1-2 TaxID=2804649 RepID=UPI003CE6E718